MWRLLAAFVAGVALGATLPAVLLAARDTCQGAGLGLRTTAFLSLLAANGAALAGGALVAWTAGRHELVIAASSVVCGFGVLVTAISVGGRGEHGRARFFRAYALGFATPFVLFSLLGAGLVAF